MKLSIVIPANGCQADIDDTLLSVLENRPADCEVLLSHPHGYRDPYQLEDEVSLIAGTSSDCVSLLNAGISAAQGHIVHTLCPGTQVRPGWYERALHIFEDDGGVGSVAPTMLTSSSKRPVRGVSYQVGPGKRLVRQSGKNVLAPCLVSGFYLRRALQFMHGFDARFDGWADIELGLRMFSAKYRCVADGDVQIQMKSSDVTTCLNGFRAGQIRGSLFAQARSFGFAQSQGRALLTEPFRNGLGVGILTGVMGRLACRSLRPHSAHTDRPVEQLANDKRAA